MSPPLRPTRAARGRVVIVGPAPDLGGLAPRVVHAEDLFDAMGHVTSASAAEAVAAVVLPASLLDGPAALAAEAFRRIDPSLRLIALAGSDAELARLEQAPNGFDRILRHPLNAARLAEVLEDGPGQARPPPRPEAPLREAPPREVPAPPAVHVATPPPAFGEPQFVESIEIAPAQRAAPQGELGDIDLVQALLTEPLGLRDLAIRLIAQQTGWSDLAMSPQ